MNTVKDDFGSIEITHASSKFTQTLNLDRKTKRQFVDEYYELFKAPNEIRIKAAFLSNISLLDHPPCGIKIKEENWGNKVKRFVSGYGINTPPGYPSCIFKAKNQIAEISEQMTTEADAFNLSQTRSFTPTCLPDQHRTTMTWEHFLPKGFETRELVKEFRRKTINGLANCDEIGNRPEIVLGICKKGRRCQSSLCPICHRLLRREFVKLVVEYQLYQLNWSLLTVRINE